MTAITDQAASDLPGFLRRCLDEDERVAKQGRYGHNPVRDDDDELGWSDEAVNLRQQREDDWQNSWHTHRCGWQTGEFGGECTCGVPARVLTEIKAKRAILDRLDAINAEQERETTGAGYALQEELERVIVVLAQPYAGRPGWSEAWAVEGEASGETTVQLGPARHSFDGGVTWHESDATILSAVKYGGTLTGTDEWFAEQESRQAALDRMNRSEK